MTNLGALNIGPIPGGGLGIEPDPARFIHFGQTPAGTLSSLSLRDSSFTEGSAGGVKTLIFNPLVAGSFLFIAIPATLELTTLSLLPDYPDLLASWEKAPLKEEPGRGRYTGYSRGPISPEVAGCIAVYRLTLAAGA